MVHITVTSLLSFSKDKYYDPEKFLHYENI